MSTKLNAFDSFNGSYDSSGIFSKTIKIPKKNWTSSGQAVLLKPETVVVRKDISSSSTYAILEIVQHGHPYYDSLAKEPLDDVPQSDDLTIIISGFDPSEGKDVRVITIHDEDFTNASNPVKQQIIARYASYIANNESGSIEKSSLMGRPQTLGNGILKP